MNKDEIIITSNTLNILKQNKFVTLLLGFELILFSILILILKLYLVFIFLLIYMFIFFKKIIFLLNHGKDYIKLTDDKLVYYNCYKDKVKIGNNFCLKNMKRVYTFNKIDKYYERNNKFIIYGSIKYKNIEESTGKVLEKYNIKQKDLNKIFENNEIIKEYLENI